MSFSVTALMAGAGMAVAVLAGSLLTAQAVVAGDLTGTFARFVGSILIGAYYLFLHRMATARASR